MQIYENTIKLLNDHSFLVAPFLKTTFEIFHKLFTNSKIKDGIRIVSRGRGAFSKIVQIFSPSFTCRPKLIFWGLSNYCKHPFWPTISAPQANFTKKTDQKYRFCSTVLKSFDERIARGAFVKTFRIVCAKKNVVKTSKNFPYPTPKSAPGYIAESGTKKLASKKASEGEKILR